MISDCHNQRVSLDIRWLHNLTQVLSDLISTCFSRRMWYLTIIILRRHLFINLHFFLLSLDDFFLSFFSTLSICTMPGRILSFHMSEYHFYSSCLSYFIFCFVLYWKNQANFIIKWLDFWDWKELIDVMFFMIWLSIDWLV